MDVCKLRASKVGAKTLSIHMHWSLRQLFDLFDYEYQPGYGFVQYPDNENQGLSLRSLSTYDQE